MLDVNKQIREFSKEFQKNKHPIKVSFRSLCSQWAWAKRSDVYTHLMHRYPAKILPYIPIYFLSSTIIAEPDDYVMDNFSGTGTVLLESIVHPYIKRDALGIEINPLARLIAKVKTTPLDEASLSKEIADLVLRIKSIKDCDVPEFSSRDFWFPKHTQVELAKIKSCIEEVKDIDYRDFFLVCLSQIIRDVSLADPKIAPPVLLKAEHFSKNRKRQLEVESLIKKKRNAQPVSQFINALNNNFIRIKAINKNQRENGEHKARVIWDDARAIKKGYLKGGGKIEKRGARPIRNGEIGLVITSPPYINAQKYIRTTRLELLWLDLVKENQLKDLDRRLIGTERVTPDEYREMPLIGMKSADYIVGKIFKKNKKRATIVSRYFKDMREIMKETYRVLKPRGRFILVIGNNTVCQELVENHKILAEIGTREAGFKLDTLLVDAIRSRGMITKRHETSGMLEDEYVLMFSKD